MTCDRTNILTYLLSYLSSPGSRISRADYPDIRYLTLRQEKADLRHILLNIVKCVLLSRLCSPVDHGSSEWKPQSQAVFQRYQPLAQIFSQRHEPLPPTFAQRRQSLSQTLSRRGSIHRTGGRKCFSFL